MEGLVISWPQTESTTAWLQVRSAVDCSSRIIPCVFHKILFCIVTPEWYVTFSFYIFCPSTKIFSFRAVKTPIFCPAEVLLNQQFSITCLCGWLFLIKNLRLPNLSNIMFVGFLFLFFFFFYFFRLHLQFVKIIWTSSPFSNTLTFPPTLKIF